MDSTDNAGRRFGRLFSISNVDNDMDFRYRAAAIYLEQGESNEKFYCHPRAAKALPLYQAVHSRFFNIANIAASIILLCLALIEHPATVKLARVTWHWHILVEMTCLSIVTIELLVRLYWLGWPRFMAQRRSVFKILAVFVMLLECFAILLRNKLHWRYSRALRPIFLLDCPYLHHVRRLARQTLQALPAMWDILLIILAFMASFSVLGYFLFRKDDPVYFGTPATTFVSLFVLFTTSNNPDVWLASYDRNRWNALFFIIYLIIELYFLMNLLLAVVYDSFSTNEKVKFRKLYLHRLAAARKAFVLLQNDDDDCHGEQRITRINFFGLLKRFKPSFSARDLSLVFQLLDTLKSRHSLSLDDFCGIYEAVQFTWTRLDESHVRYDRWKCIFVCCEVVKKIGSSKYFNWIFQFFALLCALWFITLTFLHNNVKTFQSAENRWYIWSSVFFVTVFSVETTIKFVTLGLRRFARSGWCIFEFLVLLASLTGLLVNGLTGNINTSFIMFRAIGLFRFLQRKRRYRDVFNAVTILLPRLVSCLIGLILLYYFFAIIGMELFAGLPMKNCCRNTIVERNYAYNETTGIHGYYYLNTFDNLLISSVTLWDLMVVNDWYVIMEGYAWTAGRWSRLYFMSYYIVMMIVLNIVVVFFLETFVFRIQCAVEGAADVLEDSGKYLVRLRVDSNAVERQPHSVPIYTAAEANHEGVRWKNRFDFSKELYKDDIKKWITEWADEQGEMDPNDPEFIAWPFLNRLRTFFRPFVRFCYENGANDTDPLIIR